MLLNCMKLKTIIIIGNEGDAVTSKQQVSKEILEDIANYMSENNTSGLTYEDLAKIDSIAEANSELQQSIYDQIEAYSKMGAQLVQTKEKQKLLADECGKAYLKLKGYTSDDTDENGQDETTNKAIEDVFNKAGGTTVSDEERMAKIKSHSTFIEDKTGFYDKDKILKWYAEETGVSKYKKAGF